MNATKTKRRYFVAVNAYRSSTDDGFANTWGIMECLDKAHQTRVLKLGLPVRDECWVDAHDVRHPSYSTNGVRVARPAEVREAKREESYYPIPQMEFHSDLEPR
jgi:hypothetical protein